MKSQLRKPLPCETLQRIVNDSFDNHTKVISTKQLYDGYFSLVYDLTLEDPALQTILKISPPPDAKLLHCEKDLLRKELKINSFIRENTSVPVPEVISYRFDRKILDRDYIFFQKLHGTPLNRIKKRLSEKEYEAIKEMLGVYLAEMHSIKGEFFGDFDTPEQRRNKSWKEFFIQNVREIINDGVELGAVLPRTPEKMMDIFEKNAACLEDVTEPRLTYVDLWEGNVFIAKSDGGYYIEGIIDSDRAYWGDPCYDFVSSVALFRDITREKAFLKGYSSKLGEVSFTPSLSCRLQMYRAYYDLQVIVERRSRKYQFIFSFLLWCYVTRHLNRILKYLESRINMLSAFVCSMSCMP
ncbi:MAG: aminoglycoside phosphotransferase family protein [Gammaproteobacteria bacterium]|nr:aminoglycoside phosphotransferase family protein [Gammaproteobacteria bacterium]